MSIFDVYALLQYATIIIVIFIVIWRGVMRIKDIITDYTEKAMEWIRNRRLGI